MSEASSKRARPPDLISHLREGNTVLMDGAMGTELEIRGVPSDAFGWSALSVRDHGHTIKAVHTDYLAMGARLHIVNSFALARHVLEPVGLGSEFERYNRRVVELFDETVEEAGIDRGRVWAAGSVSTFAANSDRSQLPTGPALTAACHEQAGLLVDAGADLIAL